MADLSQFLSPDDTLYTFKDNSAIVSISRSGNTYTATRHDGTTFEFTQKDDDTTYTFENGTNSFTVTPSGGTAQTVTVTPSIANATQSADGLMSATDKTKLDGVATGAEVNQNAFSNVKVGSTTLAADSKTDTLEFVAGDNITLEPTEVSDKIKISSSYTNTTYTLTQDGTDGHKFTLTGTDGYTETITIPDANTTYTIEADTTNNKIKLIPSSGSAVSITVPFATNATNATNATKATGDESGNNIKNTYAASFSISDHTITLKNKNGTSLGTVTVPDNNTTYSFATGDSNGQIKVTPSEGSAQNISVKGLGTAAFKNTTDTYSSSGTDPVTGKAVASALETLPTPMVFKGTLGAGGTISQLPTASASTVGNTYRVITNGTYAGQVAKDGDEFIGAELSSGVYSWVYIPSADEPSGTVTSVGITNGGGLSVSGSPITTSGTITISHADTSSQASVDNSGRTYIQDISLDTYGHVTKITSATETVVNTDRYVNSASFAYDSTNDNVKMTLTRAGSDTATVPANIPKVSSSSAGVVPKGAAVSSQSQSTKFLREDGTWAKPSYTTNTNTTYTLGTSGNTVTLTPSSGSVQSITVPFATNATNATKATQDASGDVITTTYRKLSNNDFDTVNATEVNAGDLIVTGVGRFTNGLYGDLSGTATKVSNSLKIQLNSGTTEGTNQFTYDGSAAKTVNITKSAIGLGNVDNTADANKNVASANTAGSATKATQDESGNNIKATYAASFSISDHTITLKNKNGVSLGTVTVPDNNDNTWRKVQVNGTDILGTATNTNPLNLKAGTNVSLSNSSGTVTITATDTNTTYTIGTSGNNVTLTPSSGSVQSITVPYATNAGTAASASSVAWGNVTGKPNRAGSDSDGGAANTLKNFQVSLTGSLGLDISTNSVGYVGGLTRADWNYQMTDGAIYGQTYSAAWKHEIFGDYRTGHMSVRGKNNGTWQPWNLVLDSGNVGYIYSSTVTYNPHERKFITSKSTSTWDAQVYSKQGYIDNVYVSFRPAQTNMAMMIGLDSNPSESTGYDKIDYCWYTQNSGSLSIYENNTSIGSISGHTTYAAGDELRVEYSGGYVRYYHNGVLCRSVARAIGEKLYMDSSLHGASSTFYDVYFGNSITKASAAATADTATSATTATTSTQLAEDISYINSGTSFVVHTDKKVFKTYLSRRNNLGINSSATGGMMVLAGTWESGNYTSELALGMGDNYGIYYRGSNSSAEQAWQAVGRFTSTPTGGKVVIADGAEGGVTTTENVPGTIFAVTSINGTTGGISLYGGTTYVTNYGIAFRGTSTQGKHGYVQSDWATYFTMDGADTRGWVFKNAARGKGNVASISSAGHMVLNGSLTLGGNTTNTSGVRQVYNSTTKSLDFVFVA